MDNYNSIENHFVNKEWENFISSNYECLSSDEEGDEIEDGTDFTLNKEVLSTSISEEIQGDATIPTSSKIYISTKTKIAYLNMPIDLKIFWDIPIIPYAKPCDGIIKKQIKINSIDIEELISIQEKLKKEKYFEEHIITNINNPEGRIKFKDIRKISIGLSKKDLMSYRCKKKSAFYNCFVLILRLKFDTKFKEFHVKVFNTGKLEIPGIQNDLSFDMILKLVHETLQPHITQKLEYKSNSCETVLVNSNFNCGFYINREIFNDILRYKYNIQSIYDPCSYPGIQCKFYYNTDITTQTGCQISEVNKDLYVNITKISFMVFRTGSILIVGKCDEHVLLTIYEFLKVVLKNEYKNICQKNVNMDEINEKNLKNKDKKKKIRKKNIMVTK